LRQAGDVVFLAQNVLSFFEKPGPDEAVKKAGRQVKSLAAKVKAEKGPRREDWLGISRWLSDMADKAGWAVEETGRFGVESDQFLKGMARSLAGAARELLAGLEALDRGKEASFDLLKARLPPSAVSEVIRATLANRDEPTQLLIREAAKLPVPQTFAPVPGR